jgi:putative tricarboxylic transport membrane protein
MLEEVLRLLVDPWAIFTIFWSMTLGIIMGAMPGLTGPMAMALLLGIAYTMPIEYSVLAMMLIYMGGVYGGSLSAILLNIPGAPASAATAIDGYQLAQQGKAGRAIALTTIASCIGTLIAVAFMAFLTPWLVKVSLLFTSWELLLLVLLGVLMAGALSGDDPIKGWIAGMVGLLIAQIGLDDLHMHPRFSYGSHYLEAGIGLVAAIVGLFGISQVVVAMRERDVNLQPVTHKIGRIMPTLEDLKGRMRVVLQSGVIGSFVGILPGLGADMGAWISYVFAKRTSRNPELYGKGSTEGVIAAETGNNAVVPSSLIPVIALGLPGSAGAAIIMAALFVHGLVPGPMFLHQNLDLFEYMVIGLIFGTVAMLIVGLALAHVIVHVLLIPRENIMAVVIAMGVMGAYASKLQYGDVWIMLVFGALAYGMRRLGFPLAPMVLGIVLGSLLDEFLRNALIISGGSLMSLVTRPIAFGLLLLLLLTVITTLPICRRALGRLMAGSRRTAVSGGRQR